MKPSFSKVNENSANFITIQDLFQLRKGSVQGYIISPPQIRKVASKQGKTLQLQYFRIKDQTTEIGITLWEEKILEELEVYDKIVLQNIILRQNHKKELEISLQYNSKLRRIAWPKSLEIHNREQRFLLQLKRLIKHNLPTKKSIVFSSEQESCIEIDKNHLIGLNLSFSGLNHIPSSIGELNFLKWVNLRNNHLELMPETFWNLKKIEICDLSWNRFDSIPSYISHLSSVREMYLQHNNLKTLPDEVLALPNIQKIGIAENPLEYLPSLSPELILPKKTLYQDVTTETEKIALYIISLLCHQDLPSLDSIKRKSFGYSVKNGRVQGLGLYAQRLQTIPISISKFTQLSTLDLSYNRMKEIPMRIEEFPYLNTLYFKGNHFSEIPVIISQIFAKKYLSEGINPQDVQFLVGIELFLNERLYPISNIEDDQSGYIVTENSLSHLKMIHRNLVDLPDIFDKIPKLEYLNLSGNALQELPPSIDSLQSLKILLLNSNKFADIPDFLACLPYLENLHLDSNEIVLFPESVCNCNFLHDLSLKSNLIEILPEKIVNLKSLQTLNLESNKIVEIPTSLSYLGNLVSLNLAHNSISQIQFNQIVGSQLKCVNLSFNQLSTVPNFIEGLKNLEKMKIIENSITKLPDFVFTLPSIKHIEIDLHKVEILPHQIKMFEDAINCRLLTKEISHQDFTSPINDKNNPDALILKIILASILFNSGLDPLKILNKIKVKKNKSRIVELTLSHLNLTNLPEIIWKLTQLKKLHLENNKIENLSEDISNLINLEQLTLAHNKLTTVPSSLGDLISLKILDLSNNELEDLPFSIENLEKISRLTLDGNKFEDIPACIWNLRSLTHRPFLHQIPSKTRGFLINNTLEEYWDYSYRRRFFLTDIQIKFLNDESLSEFDRKELQNRTNASKLIHFVDLVTNDTVKEAREIIQEAFRVKRTKYDILL